MSSNEIRSSVVQSKGPAILLPAEAIGNVVTKTNILISSHRDFLANLPRDDARTTTPPPSLTTPPPSLNPRYAFPAPQILGVLPECSPAVSSASSVGAASVANLAGSLSSISSTFAQSVITLQGLIQTANIALTSASNARLSIQTSASSAISSANATATSALLASSTAASSLSSISASAALAISSMQASADAAVSSANSALSSIQSSANAQAISLNSAATLAIQQAQASVSSLSQAAAANIAASRLAAMNTTKFALAITFAILGSSLLSILVYYLVSRYRQKRRAERQLALKEKIGRARPNSDSSEGVGPSLSDFPMPVGRDTWTRTPDARSTISTEMPIQGARQVWATKSPATPGRASASRFQFPSRANILSPKDESRTVTANGMDEDGNTVLGSAGLTSAGSREIERPGLIRKNTLTYDPEHPERPPKFTTWLEESFRSVSPFPRVGAVNSPQQPEIKRTNVRRSEMGSRGGPSARGGIGTAM